eukprot:COSAG05_NODE_1256_length_5360_cov_7.466831_6_plen_110_part_00
MEPESESGPAAGLVDRAPATGGQQLCQIQERYSRRFRELQCTPIANFHLQKFQKSRLEQLIELFGDMNECDKKNDIKKKIKNLIKKKHGTSTDLRSGVVQQYMHAVDLS